MLEGLGYTNIDVVENGKEAVHAVRETQYQLILMDCMVCSNESDYRIFFGSFLSLLATDRKLFFSEFSLNRPFFL